MNLNFILFVVVLLLTGGSIVRTRRLRTLDGFVLSILGVGFFIFPLTVGYVGAAIWLALIGLPSAWTVRLSTALIFADYGSALRSAWWIERFHPVRAWRIRACIQRSIVALGARDGATGEGALTSLRRSFPEWGALIELERAALEGDYPSVLRVAPVVIRGRLYEVSPLLRHLEALGEVGDIEALDREFITFEQGLRGDGRSMARLLLGVFHGEVEFVQHLLGGPCSAMSPELKQFWLGTAYQACGDGSQAEKILAPLVRSSAPLISRRARRRLAEPVAPAIPMPVELAHLVGSAVRDEERFGDVHQTAGPVTRTLLFLILGVFLVEALFGATVSAPSLFHLGAFSVGAVLIDGQWWRLITALFLHAGVAHVAFNALALHSLAPFVERSLGPLRFLLVYFGSGVGGLAAITWGTYALGMEDRLVVGASGAIMGLVGATGAILAHADGAEGSPVARERLRAVGSIIGLQIVFDILVPQTSATAHLLGAALGYLLGRLVVRHTSSA